MTTIDKLEARTIVGTWLRAKREATGLGRVRFGRHCAALGCDGIEPNTMRFWESGRQMPDMGLIAGLLAALEPDQAERRRILSARLYLTPESLEALLAE